MLYDPNWTPPATEIKLEPWQKLLLDAATCLETHGWCQGDYTDGKSFCTLGAIRQTGQGSFGQQCFMDALNKLHDHVVSHPKNDTTLLGRGIAQWNDTPGRTKEEVIATMREVATKG